MPYGPFPHYKETESYAVGDKVFYRGYKYEAMTAISPGDKPASATDTFTLSNSVFGTSGGRSTKTLPKWRLWDYPVAHIMARLRGIPDDAIDANAESPKPVEVQTICVRAMYTYGGSPNNDLYHFPDSASYSGYGLPAGLDSNWDDPEDGELMYAPSAATYTNGQPTAYSYALGGSNGIIFQPNTVAAESALALNGSSSEIYLRPAWADETLSQKVGCYATFSREYEYITDNVPDPPDTDTTSTLGWKDNWLADRAWTGYADIGDIIATDPNFHDEL